MKPPALKDQRTGAERAKIKRVVVEGRLSFGISGEQHLKAAIQAETVDLIRSNTPARRIRCLNEANVKAAGGKTASTGQPSQPGTDDKHVAEVGRSRRGSGRHGHRLEYTMREFAGAQETTLRWVKQLEEVKMSRIRRVERSEVTPEMVALYDQIFAQRGNVPNMFRTMAHRPEIFRTMMAHFAAVLNTGTVSTALKELIIVRTSQINETPYCLASHTVLARNLGWSDEQLSHLAEWPERKDFSAAEKAALKLAETVTRDAHALSEEQFAELREHFSEGEIVELLCAIGLFNYFNRFNNALLMEPTKPGEGGPATTDAEQEASVKLA